MNVCMSEYVKQILAYACFFFLFLGEMQETDIIQHFLRTQKQNGNQQINIQVYSLWHIVSVNKICMTISIFRKQQSMRMNKNQRWGCIIIVLRVFL